MTAVVGLGLSATGIQWVQVMHKQFGEQIRHRSSIRENLGLLIGVSVTIVASITMDGKGMAQKWHAAIFGTTVPFVFVVLSDPSAWLRRWSFWTTVAICLTLHLIGIWIFFPYGLINVSRLGWGRLWLPIAAVEAVALLVVVKIMRWLSYGVAIDCFP
jgi:hypothetical protein